MAFMIDLGRHTMGAPDGFKSTSGEGGPRRHDPASFVPGASPNFGDFVAPHVMTFSGVASSLAKVYRPSDEALRDSPENARYMRNDLVVMECIEARQRSTALLNCHVEPDNEKDSTQKHVAGVCTKMMEAIPRFMQYRENLLHAVFFGRYGVANRWRWKPAGGGRRITVDRWRPVHGDKLVWRWQPDDPRWDEDQVGIRVGLGYGAMGHSVAGRWPIEKAAQVSQTDVGLAYFLRPWERPLLSLHKHYIEDGEYETPEYAGRVHGVGIRSRIYWTWYQKQETLAWLMEYLERSAGGFEVWFYPWGNDAARQAVEKAARERQSLGRNQLLVPKFLENDQFGQWYDRIEPSMAGAQALKEIIVEYFGHLLKRYILGQTLTTESGGTGLGSNLADVHLATFLQIVKYDATNLEETLTTELLEPMIRFNFPWAVGIPFRVRIDTESENAHEKLEALEKAYNMGLKLKAQDLYDVVGATKPQPGDEILDRSSQQQAGGLGGLGALLGGNAGDLGKGDNAESAKPDGKVETTGGTDDLDTPNSGLSTLPNKSADGGGANSEHYAADFEAQHPRAQDGQFVEKEPWQRTPDEHFAQEGSDSPETRRSYAKMLKAAAKAKKPIPDAVLKDNPDIAALLGRSFEAWELTKAQHDTHSLFAAHYTDAHADHKREVKKAAAAGKPVPGHVLAEYKPSKTLPGLPALPERKVDWTSSGGDSRKAIDAAAERKGGQYRSQPGQRGLFEHSDNELDRQHLAGLEAAHGRGALTEDQALAAGDWVRQHGHHPQWHVLRTGSLFGGETQLIGRVDRAGEAFAVQIGDGGKVDVYHWPGFGKSQRMKFASTLIPLHQAGGAAAAKATAQAGMLFSRSGPKERYAADPSWDESNVNRNEKGEFAPKDAPRSKAAEARKRDPSDKGTHASLRELVEASRKDQHAASGFVHEYATIGSQEASRLKQITGIDFDGYAHSIDGSTVLHVLGRHGEEQETRHDHIALTLEDFEALPDVIANPDGTTLIEPGTDGKLRIRHTKRTNGYLVIVEEERRRKGRLAIVSMRKVKFDPEQELNEAE